MAALQYDVHLVLVLRARGAGAAEGSEVSAAGAGLGAGVQLTQLQEVTVPEQVLAGQVRDHRRVLQHPVALRDGTADVHHAHLDLDNESHNH